jgi:hypothetical protein
VNSSAQTLDHLFIKCTIYGLFSLHKFVTNDAFNIKKMQSMFSSALLHSHDHRLSMNLCHSNTLVADDFTHFSAFQFSVSFFFNFI